MTKRAKVKHASRTEIVDMIRNSGGKIMTITFTKKDGGTRVMNCNRSNGPATNLGYFLVNDMQEKGKKKTKTVDPRTITDFKFGGRVYRPKD